jgi:diguanylate cyclase (GGDEF)-like protein
MGCALMPKRKGKSSSPSAKSPSAEKALFKSPGGAISKSEERYALAFAGSRDGAWDWDLIRDSMVVSERFKELLSLEGEGNIFAAGACFSSVHPDDVDLLHGYLDAHLTGKAPFLECVFRVRAGNDLDRWVLLRGICLRKGKGKAHRMAGSLTDITSFKQVEHQLLQGTLRDPVCALPNRALFMDRVERSVRLAGRRADYKFAVLVLDIDRFKKINDSFGHVVGDDLLKQAARRLKPCVRKVDTVARLAADEFGLLLDDIKGESDATRVAKRINMALSPPFRLGDEDVFITASVGIALSTTGYERADEIFRDAGAAMNRAKALGTHRYEMFDTEMHASALELLKLENDLRRAIDRRELGLHYQPIVSMETGRVMGFEALLRWNHPRHGQLAPAKFLRVAEETGLIVPIDRWVLRQVCHQMVIWNDMYRPQEPFWMSVNVSGKHFSDTSLPGLVDEVCKETGIDGQRLRLELTESVVMEDVELAKGMLAQLKKLGVHLSIDDFGTGYSSLSSLHHFPIDTLKIDRSFVSQMHIAQENSEIVRTIIELAKNLNMNVVAEGVETPDQFSELRALKCDLGQGFLFSRPTPSKRAGELIGAVPYSAKSGS